MENRRIIIVGASSGIGKAVAELFLADGWIVGLASRNISALRDLCNKYPDKSYFEEIDLNLPNSDSKLKTLIDRVGGMDIYFHVAGIGSQNYKLDSSIECNICNTNVLGFTRMVDYAFNYFADNKAASGHIAIVSSIAGTKGLGISPAYSATKRYQNIYIECLEQLSYMRKAKIRFTDIRPGFVKTPLLDDGNNYPMLMNVNYVAHIIKKSILKRKKIVVIDWKYKLLVSLWRLIPRWIWVRIPAKTN